MNYAYNRTAFRSVCDTPGVHPLATAYCHCVLMELSLKQYLAVSASPVNEGHDLPTLIQRVGLKNRRYLGFCNALQRQLADALRGLHSQGKDGGACIIPSRSYPHLRYLRHESNWPSPCNSDTDIDALNNLLKRITHLFRNEIRLNI